jgi:hypothetical protein
MRTAEESAILVAILLRRSGLKRARLSEKTIRRLSGRRHLRRAFVDMLDAHLADLGILLTELERGGFGLMPSASLSGATAITAKKYLATDLEKLSRNESHWVELRAELEADLSSDEESDT